MEYKDEIKELRVSMGLSQQKLSDLLEIPLRTIEAWERGLRVPPDYVQRLVLKEMRRIKDEQ